MASDPLIYVLVINWNGREHLQECFDTLLAGTYPNARFVLIDNASTDGSLEFVRERYGHDSRVEILPCDTNLGWSRGNNVGIAHAMDAGADYVFLLNNDTATAPDAATHLVEMAEAKPEIGALAPKMLLYDNPDLINSVGIGCSIIGNGWDIGLGRLDSPKWNEPRPVAGVCGGACFLRVSALRRTGLLPDDFDMYLDDLDLCLRIWNAGYEISSCPRAVVRHKFSATMGVGARQRLKYYWNTRNRARLILRNYPASQCCRIAYAFAIGEYKSLGRAALNGEFWRIGAHVKALGASLAYVHKAIAARRHLKSQGFGACRFWSFVQTHPLFSPGVELPTDGWYAPRIVYGEEVRPMSKHAHLVVEAGPWRLAHANPYPNLGETRVQAFVDGNMVAELTTRDRGETVLELPRCRLEFLAQHIFDAEATGERMDIGGWLSVEPTPLQTI